MTSFTLTEAQLRSLRASVGHLSPLSPLATLGDGPSAPLPEFMAGTGEPVGDWDRVARILGECDRSGGLTFVGPELTIQAATYGLGDAMVMVHGSGEDLVISDPPEVGRVVRLVRQLLGDALVGIAEFELSLPIDEARTLAAVVDAARRHVFRFLAGDGDAPDPSILLTEVVEATRADDPSAWLAPYFDRALGVEPLTAAEVEAGLQRLEAQAVVKAAGGSSMLGDEAAAVLDALLLVDGHLKLRSAVRNDDGSVGVVDLQAIRGGRRSAVVWSESDGLVTLNSSSGLVLAELAGRFLIGPEMLVADVMADLAGSATQASEFCPSCGTQFLPDGQFCTKCGAKRP